MIHKQTLSMTDEKMLTKQPYISLQTWHWPKNTLTYKLHFPLMQVASKSSFGTRTN